jgi:23S rRNA U2552 (ribose-2'-O)-methylase RlmE/FtsJ
MTAKQMRKALWDALDGDTVELARVEENFAPSEHKLIPYVQERAPSDIYWEFRSHFQWLRRLSEHGYSPDFIVDVGASTGYWSLVAKRVFSKANFYLVALIGAIPGKGRGNLSIKPRFHSHYRGRR